MSWGTGIDYAHATFSPWCWCIKKSEGCKHCYAEGVGKRLNVKWGPRGAPHFMSEATWKQPLAWDRRAEKRGERYRVFVGLCDPFIPTPPSWLEWRTDDNGARRKTSDLDEARERLWRLIRDTPNLDWLIATKYPEHISSVAPALWLQYERGQMVPGLGGALAGVPGGWPDNLWLGVTCENQPRAVERLEHLERVPAAVRWVSYEPALGPVDFDRIGNALFDRRAAIRHAIYGPPKLNREQAEASIAHPWLNWVVIGCESGPGARPFKMAWLQSVANQCAAAGVPLFTKQVPGSDGRLLKSQQLAVKGWPAQLPEVR